MQAGKVPVGSQVCRVHNLPRCLCSPPFSLLYSPTLQHQNRSISIPLSPLDLRSRLGTRVRATLHRPVASSEAGWAPLPQLNDPNTDRLHRSTRRLHPTYDTPPPIPLVHTTIPSHRQAMELTKILSLLLQLIRAKEIYGMRKRPRRIQKRGV